jgi:hypothetical protein
MRNYCDLATRAEFWRQYQLAAEYWQLAANSAPNPASKAIASRRAGKCQNRVAAYLRREFASMPRLVDWSPEDLAVVEANRQLTVPELQRLLPHISAYSIRKKRNELSGMVVPSPDRGASWSGLDAALCARWNHAFSLMIGYARNTGKICQAY